MEGQTIFVKPRANYRSAGLPFRSVDESTIYRADIAGNQPDFEDDGLVFVNDMLLSRDDYEVIDVKTLAENLMSTSDIAAAAGVGNSAVSNWKARHVDFPQPVLGDLYLRDDVAKYLASGGDET